MWVNQWLESHKARCCSGNPLQSPGMAPRPPQAAGHPAAAKSCFLNTSTMGGGGGGGGEVVRDSPVTPQQATAA